MLSVSSSPSRTYRLLHAALHTNEIGAHFVARLRNQRQKHCKGVITSSPTNYWLITVAVAIFGAASVEEPVASKACARFASRVATFLRKPDKEEARSSVSKGKSREPC